MCRILGGHQETRVGVEIKIPKMYSLAIELGWMKSLIIIPIFLKWGLTHRPKRSDRFYRFVKDEIKKYCELDFTAYPAVGIQYYTMLGKFCAKFLNDEEQRLPNGLVAGIGGMGSAEAGLDMWRLAESA